MIVTGIEQNGSCTLARADFWFMSQNECDRSCIKRSAFIQCRSIKCQPKCEKSTFRKIIRELLRSMRSLETVHLIVSPEQAREFATLKNIHQLFTFSEKKTNKNLLLEKVTFWKLITILGIIMKSYEGILLNYVRILDKNRFAYFICTWVLSRQ